MRRAQSTLRHVVRLLAPLLLLGALVQGCTKSNSVLLVNVVDDSRTLNGVVQLAVRVLVVDAVSQFLVPSSAGEPISFPTSFTVEIDGGRTGAVNVTVTAMLAGKTVTGNANLAALDVGGENVVTVHMGKAPIDGGVDAGVDAGTDAASDVPADTAPGDLGGDMSADSGDAQRDATGTGGAGMGGSGMGGSGMGGAGMGGSGMGGDMGMGGDTGADAGGDTGADAGDDAGADPDAPVD
jgi:hypothetical protein